MTAVARAWRDVLAGRDSGASDQISNIIGGAADRSSISFAAGFPDRATFAEDELAAEFGEVCADPLALQYGPSAGLPGPRDWLAGRLHTVEGRRPADDELIITSGGMEAMTLVTRALLGAGDLALVEAPTFLGAIMALRGSGARVRAVPMDEDGLDVDALATVLATERPVLMYLIPDFHNPTGVSLSLSRRHQLVALAREHGMLLVEDAAYRDLGFSEPLPSLWSLAPDVTVQLGTFSKTFNPGFRMGWAAGPAELVAALIRVKQTSDQCTGAVGQLLLERHGRAGRFDRDVARMREHYARRCATMLDALDAAAPDGVRFTRPAGGFFTWLTVEHGLDPAALLRAAAARHVEYVPGQVFYPDTDGADQLRVAFSHVPVDRIAEGVERLCAAITDVTP